MHWGPSIISIVVALLVAVVIGPPVPVATAMKLGLAFEVASSYGIAAAEFTDPPSLAHGAAAGPLLGRGVDRALHGRRADRAPARGAGGPGVRQLGAGDRRPHDRDRRDGLPAPPDAVLLLVHLSLPARRRHGVCGRARGLRAGRRGQAGAGAGQLSAGGEAGPGRDGRGLARAASPAGAAGGDQADPAVARERRAGSARRTTRSAGSSARRR